MLEQDVNLLRRYYKIATWFQKLSLSSRVFRNGDLENENFSRDNWSGLKLLHPPSGIGIPALPHKAKEKGCSEVIQFDMYSLKQSVISEPRLKAEGKEKKAFWLGSLTMCVGYIFPIDHICAKVESDWLRLKLRFCPINLPFGIWTILWRDKMSFLVILICTSR